GAALAVAALAGRHVDGNGAVDDLAGLDAGVAGAALVPTDGVLLVGEQHLRRQLAGVGGAVGAALEQHVDAPVLGLVGVELLVAEAALGQRRHAGVVAGLDPAVAVGAAEALRGVHLVAERER